MGYSVVFQYLFTLHKDTLGIVKLSIFSDLISFSEYQKMINVRCLMLPELSKD
jgi:hypothetical protein